MMFLVMCWVLGHVLCELGHCICSRMGVHEYSNEPVAITLYACDCVILVMSACAALHKACVCCLVSPKLMCRPLFVADKPIALRFLAWT